MRIRAILDIINSDRDRAGNCYWAFRYTDCRTGKQVRGTIGGGESNISAAMRPLFGDDWPGAALYTTRHSLPIREYNGLVSAWPYAGGAPEELAEFIRKGLRQRAPRS